MFNTGFPPTWSTLRKLMILKAIALAQAYSTFTGSIARFLSPSSKPVKSIVCNIEPIQDLHGYDNPWPAGGGKNLLPLKDGTYTLGGTSVTVTVNNSVISFSGTAASGGGRTVKLTDDFTLKAGTYFTKTNSNGDAVIYINNAGTNAAINTGDNRSFTLAEDTLVYAGVNVITGSDYAGKTATPMLNVGNTAEAFAPYSNKCPIGGWSAVGIEQTGKNMFNPTPARDSPGTLTFTVEAGKLTVNGTSTSTSYTGGGITKDNCRYSLKAGTYTLSMPASATNTPGSYLNVEMFDADGNRTQKAIYGHTKVPKTFTINSDVVFDWWCAIPAGTYTNAVFEIQLELSSTTTAYSPYVGTTYPIPLGTTVYGGTLDVLTGKLTVTMAYDQMTYAYLSGLSSTYISYEVTARYGPCVWVRNWHYQDIAPRKDGGVDGLCNAFPVHIHDSGIMASQYRIYFEVGNNISNVSDFLDVVQALETSGSGLFLCYEIATPQTIQLTPQQVELLQGENNIWSDGEMALVYLADGNASDVEALNILLGGRYVNNHGEDEPTDREALDILLGGTR